jgi:hypothetical protein
MSEANVEQKSIANKVRESYFLQLEALRDGETREGHFHAEVSSDESKVSINKRRLLTEDKTLAVK